MSDLEDMPMVTVEQVLALKRVAINTRDELRSECLGYEMEILDITMVSRALIADNRSLINAISQYKSEKTTGRMQAMFDLISGDNN
tara:strand:- start:58 stop:315 length:258 start_codon:yes stop_codon:yes gene_type:complete